jgi:AcrR family transcriptional regulator
MAVYKSSSTMSPRPKKVTDTQIFEAVQSVMTKVGPRDLTLAAIAKDAGVTAAVLVQRFGSKRALLLALSEKYASGAETEYFTNLRKEHDSPLAALRAYARCFAEMAASPAAFARNLAYLQIDLTDEDFRRNLVKQARAADAGLRGLVQAAVDAGELKPTVKAALLARTIGAVLSGSMMTWAFYRSGSAAQWMLADLEAILAPYLRKKRR